VLNGAGTEPGIALSTAREDRDSVLELTRALVRVPSRAGIDPYGPVLGCMSAWLARQGLRPRRLAAGGETVAMVCEITGGRPGPRYVLDACLGTAPFGDEAAWTHPPTSGEIDGGWLHGRGACDSKAGAAIFAHVAARLLPAGDRLAGAWFCCSTWMSTPGVSAAPGPTSKARTRRTASRG
jgi:succinyl-diaminopimelate desuccinylase